VIDREQWRDTYSPLYSDRYMQYSVQCTVHSAGNIDIRGSVTYDIPYGQHRTGRKGVAMHVDWREISSEGLSQPTDWLAASSIVL
jgi:hypothetical protein